MRRLPLLIRVSLLCTAALAAAGARAHEISLEKKQVTLGEAVRELQKQTGFEYRVAVPKEIEAARHDFHWRKAPLSRALGDLSAAFGCDIFSVDSSGFFIIPAQPMGKKEKQEFPVGPYRLRAAPLVPLNEEGQVQLTLVFAAPDDERMEAVAGLAGDLRVLDSFGRSLLPPNPMGIRRTTASRVRLTEYWHRLQIPLRDGRAARLRSVSGSLLLYRRVIPLRFEFPVAGAPDTVRPQPLSREGVEVRLEKWSGEGREFAATTRLSWLQSDTRDVVGRGISRTPQPYLVDANGRVYRDSRVNRIRRQEEGEGRLVQEQSVRFEGVEAPPARLVYELFLREDPSATLPFRLTDLSLPNTETTPFKPELRPFFAEPGGSLTFQVRDRRGKPLEGEVALAFSRREREGWSGWRWIEAVTAADGTLRIENLRPGTYRVRRLFRFEPSRPPVAPPGATLTVTVEAEKEAMLPALQLPVTSPEP